MARAAAKKKRDVPPLYMLVADGGRLDPAFQHDQERLMSFRKGTRLVVTAEPDGSRRGVRKWHAIIGKAVKNSLLPWVTVSAADEAIRLALDLYEPKKANDGSWHRVTQSLNDLSDEELDEQIELMSAMIYRISGVDPDEFRKELAGAGDERFASDYDRPAADNDAGAAAIPLDEIPDNQCSGEGLTDSPPIGEDSSGADTASQDAGTAATNSDEATKLAMVSDAEPDSDGDSASNSASIAPNQPETATRRLDDLGSVQDGLKMSSDGQKAPGEGDGAVSPPVAELSEEDRTWLRDGARMMLAAQPEPSAEAKDVLFRQVKSIIMLMPKAASADARSRMEKVKQHAMSVCRGEADLDVPLVARTALASIADVTPAPVKTARASK